MSAMSRDSLGVSRPMLSRPPMSLPLMIQKLRVPPSGMFTVTGTGRKRLSRPSR